MGSARAPRRAKLFERGYDLVSGGTDNHLILIDLTTKDIAGKIAAKALDRAGIELNYNTVPFDPRKPFDPSGVRIGTAAVTSRGMGEAEMLQVAAMDGPGHVGARGRGPRRTTVAGQAREMCRAFPAPGVLLED